MQSDATHADATEPPSTVTVRVTTSLTVDEAARAVDVIEAATRTDGQPPLSEHVRLHVRAAGAEHVDHQHSSTLHLLAEHDGDLAGSGHLDPVHIGAGHSHPGQPTAPVLELAVSPSHRRHGVGRAIVDAARTRTNGPLQLWAHGETGPAAALVAALGFTQTRAIWQMRRSLDEPLPEVAMPAGFTLRTFLPGIDDDAWLAVNARAFADHPEQGLWTAVDLLRRIDEPWFSAAGFLVAEDDATGGIAGFHWTKVQEEHTHGDDEVAHQHTGEVYVVGVDPAYHGRGLGRALTVAGLRHLQAQGLPEALLYVDATNAPAIAMYESLGFRRADMDILYSAP